MERYFVGLSLPSKIAQKINLYRQKFYPEAVRKHPPHITLHEPFTTPNVTAFISGLENLVRKMGPLQLEITGFGIFPGKKSTAYLQVSPTPKLTKLRGDLYRLSGLKPGYLKFTPHITLGKIPREDLSGVEKFLQSEELQINFLPEKIVVFRLKEDRAWEEFKSFYLATM